MRTAAPPREIPPPLELACLRVLWKLGEGNVRQVQRVLGEQRAFAYTTVMTLLDRLEKRGAASRHKRGRAFVYVPKVSQEAMQATAVQQLITDFFDGSKETLIRFLTGADELLNR